jgi:acetoin utilization protein AcuB
MLISEWMTRDPVTLTPDDSIGRAAAVMANHHIRRIPIVDARNQLVGIVTKSDVLGACPPNLNPFSVAAPSDHALSGPIRRIMTHPAIAVDGNSPIEAAAQVMVDRRISGLPVVLGDRLAGMLTESDVFRAFTAALGGPESSLRITFDVSRGEDPIGFVVDLARRHGLRVASVATYSREDSGRAVVRLIGVEPPGLVEEIWKTGHRVLSVFRLAGGAASST